MATEEGWHTTEDGMKLYTKTWKAEGPAKARLVFVHGFSDHCNAYGILFPTLATQGIEVLSFDQRGWGRSVHKPSEKGLTGPTARVLADITSFLSTAIPCPVPLFLMGHSMGGAEVLCYAAEGPADTRKHIRGYLLESPFVDFNPASRPSHLTVIMGRIAGKLLPHKQMVQVIDAKFLSRDPEVQKAFIEDKLCHDTGTLEGLAGMLDRAAGLTSGKIKVGKSAGEGDVTRIWISHGTVDKVCSFDASKKLADQLAAEDKEFKAYDGWYHKVHAEPTPDNETFAYDVASWILARSSEPVKSDGGAKSKL
ncbi:alpha/beta-hydrolase [Glonium stellatum]|uniref:Alpha/beta-hydrolase n=1 Tax=Glonium stellatum TaxID=574774 RepID=A0A8E2FC12_9PEZI|nr:alpha/beta-hydrolase [Glonium stellatum]